MFRVCNDPTNYLMICIEISNPQNYEPLLSNMQALNQAKAQALITQLEQQQQAQIQCLQALFGLSSEDNVTRPEVTDKAKGTCTHVASFLECCSASPYACR